MRTLTYRKGLLDPSQFVVLDTEALWPQFRPLMEHRTVRCQLESCMQNWIAQYPARKLPQPWCLSRALKHQQPAPWEFTTSDGLDTEIDERITDALEQEDPRGVLAEYGLSVVEAAESLNANPRLVRMLKTLSEKIRREFEPHPDHGPTWWLPQHSCFYVAAPVALALGQVWRSEGDWRVVRGAGHATAVDFNQKQVLDLLWKPDWKCHPFDLFTRRTIGHVKKTHPAQTLNRTGS